MYILHVIYLAFKVGEKLIFLNFCVFTYNTTTILYTKNIQPSRGLTGEHMQYLQGWNVCLFCVSVCS